MTGLVVCGECGGTCHVYGGGPVYKGKEYPKRYRCPRVSAGACSNRGAVSVGDLEAEILTWWRGLVDQGAIKDLARRAVELEHAEAMAAAAQRKPLDDEVANLDRQELHLVDAIREAGISPVIQRELEHVRRRRAEVEAEALRVGSVVLPLDIGAAVEELHSVLAEISSVTVLRDHLESIVLTGQHVVVLALSVFHEFDA